MKRSVVHIGPREFVIEQQEDGSVVVDGSTIGFAYNLRDRDRFDLRLDENVYDVEILERSGDGAMILAIDGKHVQVQVDDEKSLLMKKYSVGQSRRTHAAHIKAPMPGKIVKVLVQQGDAVVAGQGVLILEAMKMENEIKSISAGTVKAVMVKDQDAVEKNALLIEID